MSDMIKKPSTIGALRYGFYTLFENFGFFLKVTFAKCGLYLLALCVCGLVVSLFYTSLMPLYARLLDAQPGESAIIIKIASILILIMMTAMTVFSFLRAGILKVYLEFFDSRSESIAKIWSILPLTGRIVIADIVFFSFFIVGLIMFVIPGFYFATVFGFYRIILVDTQCGVIESFKKSAALTHGYRWYFFGFNTLIKSINTIASLIPFLSVFITLPALDLAYIHLYRQLSPKQY